jgi:hypothetical protein
MKKNIKKFANLVFRICVLVSSPLILIVIGLQSRPSADEYLAGPVFNGFYVDRTDGFLFEPSSNLFVRYLQGTKAIYQLGWDGLLNAATLQMGASLLINYFGPLATIVQSMVFASVFWLFLYVLNSRILLLRGTRLHAGILITLSAFLAAFAFADFNTFRLNFGFFPFTGIRFGIYAFSTWLLVLLIFYFELQLQSKTKTKTKTKTKNMRFFFSVVFFAGFASLWFVMFWFMYLFISFFTCLMFRVHQRSQYKQIHLKVVTVAFLSMMINHNLSSVLLNRTALNSSDLDNSLIGSLRDTLLGNYRRMFNWELWNLSFGFQLFIGIGVGIFISIFFRLSKEQVSLITPRIIINILVTLSIFPILFYMQEQLTYEAWWHRTPLIALSLTSGLLIGVFFATGPPLDQPFVRLPFIALITSLLVIGLPKLAENFNELTSYRQRWDNGDPFGIDSPLANNEVYNQVNLLKIKPYRPPNWKPSIDVLTHVSVDLNRKSNGDLLSLQPGEFTNNAIITLSDPMLQEELFRELSVSFLASVSDEFSREVFLRVTDKNTVRVVRLLPGTPTTVFVKSGLPGQISLEDATSRELSFRISDLRLDFGSEFKKSWRIGG